jgi:hypothetical protein
MLDVVLLDRALSLPAGDIAALLQGQLIVAIPRVPIQKGWTFALCPYLDAENGLPIEQQYRSHSLPLVQNAIGQQQSASVEIEAWANCEHCVMLHELEQIEALSKLTIWTKDALKQALEQRQHLFLAFLQIYRIPQAIAVPSNAVSPQKFGKFLGLSDLDERLRGGVKIPQSPPVVSDRTFAYRKQQLEELRPPDHPELEELQSAISQLAITHPIGQALDLDLKIFLGWADPLDTKEPDPDLTWIETISKVGNSSDGHAFEKLVRRGLLKLGFSGAGIDPNGAGGAGGMDFYCESPYSIVGECKATKTEMVCDGTPAQLLKIGMNHLGKKQYDLAIKLIVAAGDLNFYALRTARENFMNVIRPETLQSLVELQTKHRGSINLLELKNCLAQEPFGLADDKVNHYITQTWQNIRVRSHIVNIVKKHLEKAQVHDAGTSDLHTVYIYSNPLQPLNREQFTHILIELSSPLTGYLGREKASDGSDRFYFLRELTVD